MDVKINTDNLSFKYRVNSIIIQDGKVLLLDMNKNGFLCLPGGHVHIGEDTREAVIRETKEETGIKSKTQKLVAVIENFFTRRDGKKCHELSFYYKLDNLTIPGQRNRDFHYIEHDEDKLVDLDFKWIPLDEVEKHDVRPLALKKILMDKKWDFTHTLVKE